VRRPLTARPAIALLGAALLIAQAASAHASPAPLAYCNQTRWCTVTASSNVTPTASQLAIGNVRGGTKLAVTAVDTGQKQIGGQILSGTLAGVCGWSQYQRDWTATPQSAASGCADPVTGYAQFVAGGGHAVWTGCYPRCFGGVPLRYEARCGRGGRNWCYGRNCTEFANYFPWSTRAHPADPIRKTQRHMLDVRYLALHGDEWTGTPFYLVRDQDARHGAGNWVFVSSAECQVRVGRPGTYHYLAPHQRRRH
jgi:hypothetical protein